jgi:membrane fusion protein, multidrug efflux system
MSKSIKIFIGSLFLLLLSCQQKDATTTNAKPNVAPIAADVVICKNVSIEAAIELNGTIVANDFVELRPEMSGRIVTLNVKEGALVGKDILIAKLYDDDLQAQLRKNHAQLTIAQANEQRLKKLLALNGINQQEYDQVNAQVVALLADIDFVNAQIRKTEIRSPFSGRVGLRNISQGAYVTPQTIITTLQAQNGLKVDFNVPEHYASLVKAGTVVEVAIEGKSENGKAIVYAIEPQINQATRNLKVRATLKNENVQVGAFAKIMLPQVMRNAITIPTNAIIPDTRNKKVFVLRGGKAQYVIVETGVREKDVVEVTAGLQVGDTVAVSGLLYLRPDAVAKVKSVLN